MYTTIIHPIRKAFMLSINEYCVLDSIYNLSNNSKYGGWCIQSNSKIASNLDLSTKTITRCKNALELKGLIEVGDNGWSKPTDMFREIMQDAESWKIFKSDGEFKLASGKIEFVSKGGTKSPKGKTKSLSNRDKLSHNTNSNTNKDTKYNTSDIFTDLRQRFERITGKTVTKSTSNFALNDFSQLKPEEQQYLLDNIESYYTKATENKASNLQTYIQKGIPIKITNTNEKEINTNTTVKF